MSETNALEEITEAATDELSVLKMRAQMMGIKHSNNIGVETLRKLITDKQSAPVEPVAPVAEANPLSGIDEVLTKPLTIAEFLQATEMKLIRIRVTNMDPKKKDLKGEIFTVANEYLGTVRKFVPYGDGTDHGWHVPMIIYNHLKSRKFINITTTNRGGQDQVTHREVAEFAIDVLDPLTPEELNRLASVQAAEGLSSNE